MAAGVKGTKGVVKNLSFPPEVWARIEATARQKHYSGTAYAVRFLIDNLDVLAPEDSQDG